MSTTQNSADEDTSFSWSAATTFRALSDHARSKAEAAQTKYVPILTGCRHGLEKESLRVVESNNKLASTPHSKKLGSKFTHESITTDYAENLLEFVTSPYNCPHQVLSELVACHKFATDVMDAEEQPEFVWTASMPPDFGEGELPHARFGSSNPAKMKEVYRQGLKVRYGESMQAIAGIHFNFSFGHEFFNAIKDFEYSDRDVTYSDVSNEKYFGLIRNYIRYGWIVALFYGSSPLVCKSFLKGKTLPEELIDLEGHKETMMYVPNGTSIRLSNIGYSNFVQKRVDISYESLDQYLRDMHDILSRKSERFEEIGLKDSNGEYNQLNTNFLQIENEFYNPIRPKQTPGKGERPSQALKERGVSYVEVRAVDINPLKPVGIEAEDLLFMHIFLIFCILQPSPSLSFDERTHCKENLSKTSTRGRDPSLKLYDSQRGKDILLSTWVKEIYTELREIAKLVDRDLFHCGGGCVKTPFSSAVESYINKFETHTLPSETILSMIKESGEDFPEFVSRQSREFKRQFLASPLSIEEKEKYQKLAAESLKEQEEAERATTVPFDEYRQKYFEFLEHPYE